jgi:diguanylate cyclase (GGDEF)-like protein
LGRLGGEEFGFLLPEQNLVQAGYVISRLMTKTREHSFVYNSKVIPITFSAGLATISPEVSNLDMLIKSADQKLYSAKSAGGNCYIS